MSRIKHGISGITLAAIVASAALAQPSYVEVPFPGDTTAIGVSPSGRYVTGQVDDNAHFRAYRWDRTTGQFLLLSALGLATGKCVLDDGTVFGETDRVFKWSPDSGNHWFATRPAPPPNVELDDRLRDVSRDGRMGVGGVFRPGLGSGFGFAPTIYDFTTFPEFYSVRDLDTDFEGLSGIDAIVPTGTNTWRLYGTNENRAQTWLAGIGGYTSAQQLFAPWVAIKDVSPDGSYVLGVYGNQTRLAGDGPEQVLAAPTTPAMYAPQASELSDDARVIAGAAWHLGLNNRDEPVIWRKGLAPARLRDILGAVGIALPDWYDAEIHSLSADGSVLAGSYRTQGTFDGRGFVAVLPSLNDVCQTARPVTYGAVLDSTNGATRAGVTGTCSAESTAPDVWFSFTPLANETITIDTCGSNFDTTLMVFQAASCANLGGAIACNDDASPACAQNAASSRVSISVFQGQNYFIRVSGWNGAKGTVNLTIAAPNRPANDTCAQATIVSPGSGAFFSNANAITDARPNCDGAGTPFNDVWFKTTPTENGRMTYSTCGSQFNPVMIVYPGSACGNVSTLPIACGQSNAACGGSPGTRITVPSTAGQAHLIRVGGLFGSTGSGQFTARFACDQNDLSPYNVAVVNSQPLAYWRFDDSGSVTAADAIRPDPFTCGGHPGTYSSGIQRANDFQGRALSLNGTGTAALFDVVPNLGVTDPAICPDPSFGATLEAWVKTTDPAAGVIMTSRNAPSQHSLTLVVGYNPIGIANTAGRVMFVSDGPGVFFGGISTRRIDDGRWHHVVGRRVLVTNGEDQFVQLQVFIDGEFDSTELPGVGFTYSGANGQNWVIGNGPAWTPQDAAFTGMIDEVAVYCGALGNTAIASHYAIGRPPAPPCSADFNTDGELNADDLADYINCYFANPSCPGAEFNADGSTNADDLGDYINAYFAGC